MTAASSTWGPLRIRLFRTLWIAALVSNVGEWMQTVGAQWLLVHGPHAALLVSLVQTADALPAVLFALVARGTRRSCSACCCARPCSCCQAARCGRCCR